ncbi:hypothetical protein [Roseibium algae]|uniref:Uncharacterized protein n=1 Tax=Roseibium algae TaxID=3123038 RepID=A0ABU8TNI6_9HYPH
MSEFVVAGVLLRSNHDLMARDALVRDSAMLLGICDLSAEVRT